LRLRCARLPPARTAGGRRTGQVRISAAASAATIIPDMVAMAAAAAWRQKSMVSATADGELMFGVPPDFGAISERGGIPNRAWGRRSWGWGDAGGPPLPLHHHRRRGSRARAVDLERRARATGDPWHGRA